MCANAQRVADCCQFDHDAYISNIKIKHIQRRCCFFAKDTRSCSR